MLQNGLIVWLDRNNHKVGLLVLGSDLDRVRIVIEECQSTMRLPSNSSSPDARGTLEQVGETSVRRRVRLLYSLVLALPVVELHDRRTCVYLTLSSSWYSGSHIMCSLGSLIQG